MTHFSPFLFCRMKPGVPRPSIAKDSNARSESEVVYPFGVQNDLGHVVLTRNAKVSKHYREYSDNAWVSGNLHVASFQMCE